MNHQVCHTHTYSHLHIIVVLVAEPLNPSDSHVPPHSCQPSSICNKAALKRARLTSKRLHRQSSKELLLTGRSPSIRDDWFRWKRWILPMEGISHKHASKWLKYLKVSHLSLYIYISPILHTYTYTENIDIHIPLPQMYCMLYNYPW